MTVLDKPMGKLAKTLMKKFGRPATITRPGAAGTYDPATGTVSQSAPALALSCSVAMTEFTEFQIDGTTVQRGDRKALVSGLKLEEETGVTDWRPVPNLDQLIEGGRTWNIIGLIGISSGEKEAAFVLQVRR